MKSLSCKSYVVGLLHYKIGFEMQSMYVLVVK